MKNPEVRLPSVTSSSNVPLTWEKHHCMSLEPVETSFGFIILIKYFLGQKIQLCKFVSNPWIDCLQGRFVWNQNLFYFEICLRLCEHSNSLSYLPWCRLEMLEPLSFKMSEIFTDFFKAVKSDRLRTMKHHGSKCSSDN